MEGDVPILAPTSGVDGVDACVDGVLVLLLMGVVKERPFCLWTLNLDLGVFLRIPEKIPSLPLEVTSIELGNPS